MGNKPRRIVIGTLTCVLPRFGGVSKLPEEMSVAEIAREIELLAGLQTARQQARRNEGVAPEDARKLVDAWASK